MIADPGALAAELAALEVEVDEVRCRSARLPVDDYPGGRPTTLVALRGRGQVGYGEHVAFDDEEQRAFAAAAPALLAGVGRVGDRVRPEAAPYARAALEGALIDLALAQAGRNLGMGDPRVVRSFSARADPAAHLRALRAAGDREFKVDVDPAWSGEAIAALANEPGVAILDFKERGTVALAAALARAFPSALLEDPPAGFTGARVARDRTLVSVSDVASAVERGEAVNLKAPRMGGLLPLLGGLAAARSRGGLAYLGGMFEIGPARVQARQIAALFCPDAPNDLAPLGGALSTAAEWDAFLRAPWSPRRVSTP